MSEELSDKQIHQGCVAEALTCPNCNSLIDFKVKTGTADEDLIALSRMMGSHRLVLVTVEDAIEQTKLDRAAGYELIPYGVPQ